MTYPNEIEHEEELIRRGRLEIIKDIEDKEKKDYYSNTKSGRWTLQDHYWTYAEKLEEMTASAEKGTITTKNISACVNIMRRLIDFLEPHGNLHISATALKTIIDAYVVHKGAMSKVDMATKIGSAVEQEIHFRYAQVAGDEELAATARKYASRDYSTPSYRKRATRHTTHQIAKKKKIDLLTRWDNSLKSRIGLYLLEVAVSYGIVGDRTVREGKKLKGIIFTDHFINEIILNEQKLLARSYKSHPLIDVPKDWKATNERGRDNTTGGYHLPEIRKRNPLLRNYASNSIYGDKAIDMLNTLQQTAWRIDNRVLEVANTCNEKRWTVGSFLVYELDRPEKGNAPQHIADDPKKLEEWKRERAIEHERYTRETKKNVRTRLALSIAKEYEYKTFYNSWNCDWRGRFYAQQSWLHFASTDFERSLLRFRDGCKINDDSLYWCKVAIGGAFLGSQGSFQERIRWTDDNQALLQNIAENPAGMVSQWEGAKEPWQFLQLCFEWNDVVITKSEKFWKVPIGCDATCSALQLLSALRRDPAGMKHTNLMEQLSDSEKPQDAYMLTLEVAKENAMKDLKSNLLPYLENRKVGKQLMTAVYGGSYFSTWNKIQEIFEEDKVSPSNTEITDLTKLMRKAFKQTFPEAFEALDYLSDLAKAAHEQGSQSLIWQTPTGDTIECIKNQIDTIEIHTGLLGKVSHGDFDSERPDFKKQVNAFAPCFVHSLDACVLKEAFSDWKHPLVTIHDCVKVLPKDMDRVYDRLKDAFVSVMSGDLLAELADNLGVGEEKLKRLPQLSGDLSSVRKSRYFFN